MSRAEAVSEVLAAFRERLAVVVDGRRFELRPKNVATPYVQTAVARARAARPGSKVGLAVSIHGAAVRAFVERLAGKVDRRSLSSLLSLRAGRPYLSRDHVGHHLVEGRVVAAIVRALHRNERNPLRFKTSAIHPSATRAAWGPVIVINRSLNRLSLYRGMSLWRRFQVATGQPAYPTPSGHWTIAVMWRNPWWYPPSSDWARGLSPVPPGPGNPLGTRWMGLTAPGVGIHGTPNAASIGYSESHGCIRMFIPEAEWLFDHVSIGTTVFII
jgi:lipoprotein-anchoring transpeptidase ErfK/SrfK